MRDPWQGTAAPDWSRTISFPRPAPESRKFVLRAHQLLGTQPIPVVLAEEPHTGQPPRPLEPIKIIDLVLLAMPEILTHVKMVRQPVDAPIQERIKCSFAALTDLFAFQMLEALKSSRASK